MNRESALTVLREAGLFAEHSQLFLGGVIGGRTCTYVVDLEANVFSDSFVIQPDQGEVLAIIAGQKPTIRRAKTWQEAAEWIVNAYRD